MILKSLIRVIQCESIACVTLYIMFINYNHNLVVMICVQVVFV